VTAPAKGERASYSPPPPVHQAFFFSPPSTNDFRRASLPVVSRHFDGVFSFACGHRTDVSTDCFRPVPASSSGFCNFFLLTHAPWRWGTDSQEGYSDEERVVLALSAYSDPGQKRLPGWDFSPRRATLRPIVLDRFFFTSEDVSRHARFCRMISSCTYPAWESSSRSSSQLVVFSMRWAGPGRRLKSGIGLTYGFSAFFPFRASILCPSFYKKKHITLLVGHSSHFLSVLPGSLALVEPVSKVPPNQRSLLR